MRVNEIFYSIQGEIVGIGMPSVFVRFSGCNLKCSWCDTKYHVEGKEQTIEQIIQKINKYLKAKLVVLTGGEPLLQRNLDLLIEQINPDVHIVIETNGTICPSFKASRPIFYSVSPKYDKVKKKYVCNINNSNVSSYKFVVDKDFSVSKIKNFNQDKISLMPLGTTEKEIKANSKKVVELCKRYGYTFSPRLHINIWGKKRGV